MGSNRKGIEQQSGEQWNRIWDSKDREIVQLVSMVEDFISQGIKVYINVNNHYEGSAPLTMKKIKNNLSLK
jgi:hypothetical protein